MYHYRYAISYESDTSPVETVRGEFEARSRTSAIRQGAREAVRHWPKGRKFRSWVIVVERLEAEADDTVAETTDVDTAIE
jgi:hypothetical protein